MEPVIMTPCMSDGGRYWSREGSACEKCPGVMGKFKCVCRCHKKKKKVIYRKRP